MSRSGNKQAFRPLQVKGLFLFTLLACCTGWSYANDRIRLNQLGFYPLGPKTAIVVSPETWYFSIKSPDLSTTYHSGELLKKRYWSYSKDTVAVADFSSFTEPGTYVVYVAGIGASYPFTISGTVLQEAAKGLIRAFYYQRASTKLAQTNAGTWARAAGHEDTRIIIHPSAASDPEKPLARKTGEIHPSPKGWYDAGDYGKYVVNAGISTYQLLLLYERFPAYFDDAALNIPESDNALPDLLDEIKWEMDWLLTMQDPADGGVYHKVTAKRFCGDVMPAGDRDSRYFIGKGSAATFDFVAVCAAAYRIYKTHLPRFADSCLAAARYAWEWGMEHPDSVFDNPPDVATGSYSDRGMSDERFWAAVELFIATGDSAFHRAGLEVRPSFGVPSWPGVALLGCYSLALVHDDSLSKTRVLASAGGLLNRTRTTPYRTSISTEFYWGSNGVVANQGMLMLVAYLLTRDAAYLEGAVHSCDYLFGRNAAGYSFVTGFGSRPPMNPHHRPSTADGIKEPVPGFLVGGPNAQSSTDEGCQVEFPPGKAKAWIDLSCSYTTNEVAINWNAPAAFLAGGIDAVFTEAAFDLRELREKYGADTLPPESLAVAIAGVGADRALIRWKAGEAAAVTIVCGSADAADAPRRICRPRADSGEAAVAGLLPATVYNVKVYAADGGGNIAWAVDSFRTEASVLDEGTLYRHDRGACLPGSELKIAFTHPADVTAELVYRIGGSATYDTLGFNSSGGDFIAAIPGAAVTAAGVTYSIFVFNDDDTLATPFWSIAPDASSFTTAGFSFPEAYRLVSLPGLFSPLPSRAAFTETMGDTAKWRFFGYNAATGTYCEYDTLRSGRGGWFYHKERVGFTHRGQGIPPDSLFAVTLRGGWNCVANPFPYPVYWDNCMIDLDGALLRITDSAASLFVRRQFFSYLDTSADGANNGTYTSNRDLDSYAFNDSARLDPWAAYWVYAEKDSITCLIDPSPSRAAAVLQKRQSPRRRGWFLSLRLQSGKWCDGPVVLGASECARSGYDQYDAPKPPLPVAGFHAGFPHPEWERPASLYASDIVGYDGAGGHCWPLNITSSHERPVTLQWQRTGEREGTLVLVDEKAGVTIATDAAESYTFTPVDDEKNRTIAFVWAPDGTAGTTPPIEWSFTHCGGGVHRFSYALPPLRSGCYPVSIILFDIRGRLVRRLVQAPHAPGSYTVTWNGSCENGKPAGRGVYIGRIIAGPFSKSIMLRTIR